MKKKVLILFEYSNNNLYLAKAIIKKLEKNFQKIILFNYSKEKKIYNNFNKDKRLNYIHSYYKKKNINLDLEKIYLIDNFLKKIIQSYKNKIIFVSTFYLNNPTEEDYIFYELSKFYKIQYLKPERSFFKNRYILAKNLFKQYYVLKKKTKVSTKIIKTLKFNYIKSMDTFRTKSFKKNKTLKIPSVIKFLLNIFSLIFRFRFDQQSEKYALYILGNNSKLENISNKIGTTYFVKKFLNNFDFDLVFLLHPNTNIIKFLLKCIKNKDIFFNNNRIIFLQKPKKIVDVINNSKFIIHQSSSASAQAIIFNKKILNLSKNIIYLNPINNVILNYEKNKFKYLKTKNRQNDIYKLDKFLMSLLSNSVNNKGDFNLEISQSYYGSNFRSYKKKYGKRIVINLLNSV